MWAKRFFVFFLDLRAGKILKLLLFEYQLPRLVILTNCLSNKVLKTIDLI